MHCLGGSFWCSSQIHIWTLSSTTALSSYDHSAGVVGFKALLKGLSVVEMMKEENILFLLSFTENEKKNNIRVQTVISPRGINKGPLPAPLLIL